MIAFIGQEAPKKVAEGLIQNGKYTVADVPAGKVRVTFMNLAPPPGLETEKDKGKAKAKPKPKPKKGKPEPKPLEFPPKYANEKTTDLEFTIIKGEQELPTIEVKNE